MGRRNLSMQFDLCFLCGYGYWRFFRSSLVFCTLRTVCSIQFPIYLFCAVTFLFFLTLYIFWSIGPSCTAHGRCFPLVAVSSPCESLWFDTIPPVTSCYDSLSYSETCFPSLCLEGLPCSWAARKPVSRDCVLKCPMLPSSRVNFQVLCFLSIFI